MSVARVTIVALAGATTLVSGPVDATEPWLSLEVTEACAPELAELASRIESRIAGPRNREVQVDVVLQEDGANLVASIRTRTHDMRDATRRIVASGCEETLDVVVSVASLALSSVPGDIDDVLELPTPDVESEQAVESEPAESEPASRTQPRESKGALDASHHDRGVEFEPRASQRAARGVSLFAEAGLDAGTLKDLTPLAGLGVALPLATGEVRVVGRYGLRSTTEEVATTLHRVSSDFASLGVAYCRGLDSQRWFSLCGGVAGTLTRTATLQSAGGRSVEQHRENAGFSALGGALLVYRSLSWEPQLDFAVEMAAVEAANRANLLSFQALLGAALPL